jgi:hypothetical protein
MAVPISNVTRRQVYAPSGSGGVGPYAFTFEILANTDIAVYKDDTLLTLTTHYTVTINSNGTGSVTITAAGLALSPTSPTQYAIVGNRTIARSTDFTTGGDFFANTINDELDQQTIFAQQNAEGLTRALTAPQTDPTTIDMTLPRAADRANKTLAFDANGDPTLGISASDVANAVTYATNAANSATAAASSASSASSSASSSSGSASTASTQASNASTSASSASTSASSASTSATNAAASASTATTQASNASTSATNAASSASSASTSASNAATSATNASNSASTASTQATNAASSASSASGSATSAANSAAAAASALDSFDDRYLGTKTSDPTLDNDGNALVAGALYFSTTQNVMKVYDGASWIVATSAGATSLLQFKYVATAGQTTFSGTATVGGTLTYTVNNIVVFLNGVALDSTDYTASNGTSIVLGTAAALNDELVIIAFKSFTVADTYTKGEADGLLAAKAPLASPTFTGTVTAAALTTTGNTILGDASTDTLNVGNGGLVKDASGNVGIGTSSPAQKLQVNGKAIIGTYAGTGAYGLYLRSDAESTHYNWQISTQNAVNGAIEFARSTAVGGSTFNSPSVVIDSSGNLLVGTTSATSGYLLKVAGAIHATGNHALGYSGNEFNFCGATQVSGDVYMNYRNSATAITTYRFMNGTGGTTYAACVATSFTPSSDYRIKTDVQNETAVLDKVLALRSVNYVKDGSTGREHGLIAHEVADVFPDLVGGEGKDAVDDEGDMVVQTVNYMGLTSILTAAIQEQQALITTLTDRITALEGTQSTT